MVLPELSAMQWAGAALAAALVGLSKTGFGAGAGLVAVPLMTTVLGPLGMLPVMLLVLIAGDLFSVVHYLRLHDTRNLLLLLPGLVVGVGAGYAALHWFRGLEAADLWLRRMIGFLAVGFVLFQFYRFRRAGRSAGTPGVYRPRLWHGTGIGACSGLTSTLAHAGGPLIVLYLLPQKLGRKVFVGTIIKFFFVANLLKLVVYLHGGLYSAARGGLALALVPPVVVGTFVGRYLNTRFSDRAFRLFIYCLALCLGLYLLSGWRPGHGEETALRDDPSDVFRAGLGAYRREDYAAAAEAFGAASEGGLRDAARFNRALALYRKRDYAEAEAALRRLRASAGGLLKCRVIFNRGNCAFRRGFFRRAAGSYDAARAACAELLRSDLSSGDRAVVAELARRAGHNLAVATAAAEASTSADKGLSIAEDPSGAASHDPAGEAGRGDAAGRTGAASPGTSATGGASVGRKGESPVRRLLEDAVSRDTGPVLGGGKPQSASRGPDW